MFVVRLAILKHAVFFIKSVGFGISTKLHALELSSLPSVHLKRSIGTGETMLVFFLREKCVGCGYSLT